MDYLNISICIILGLVAILLIALTAKFSRHTIWLIITNSLVAGLIIAVLNISNIYALPLSPLSMTICGVFGVPGVAFLIILNMFF